MIDRQILRFYGHKGPQPLVREYIDKTRALVIGDRNKEDEAIRAFSAGASAGIEEAFLDKRYRKSRRCCIIHRSFITCIRVEQECRPPGADHVELLIAKDKSHELLVSQPYGLYHEQIEQMMYWAFKHELKVNISAFSWHYPMRTLLVTFRKDLTEIARQKHVTGAPFRS